MGGRAFVRALGDLSMLRGSRQAPFTKRSPGGCCRHSNRARSSGREDAPADAPASVCRCRPDLTSCRPCLSVASPNPLHRFDHEHPRIPPAQGRSSSSSSSSERRRLRMVGLVLAAPLTSAAPHQRRLLIGTAAEPERPRPMTAHPAAEGSSVPRPVPSQPPRQGGRLAARDCGRHRRPPPRRDRRHRLAQEPLGPDQGGSARLHRRRAHRPDRRRRSSPASPTTAS